MSTSPDVYPMQRTRSGTVCAVFSRPVCVLLAVLTWTQVIILQLVASCPWGLLLPREVTSLVSAVVLAGVLCGVGWNAS